MSRGQLLSLVLLGGIAFGVGAANAMPQAHAAPRSTWVNFDGQWFCRSWSASTPVVTVLLPGLAASAGMGQAVWDYDLADGRTSNVTGQTLTHCTTHWHVDAMMHLLSDDGTWAPNPSGEWPVASDLLAFGRTAHQPVRTASVLTSLVKRKTTARATGGATGGAHTTTFVHGTTSSAAPSGGYNPWAPVPGHPTYGLRDFAGDPYASVYGVCTWYAWYRHQSEPLMKLGVSHAWPSNAPKYGLSVGSQPAVGATVIFQPGVEGAGSSGHAGHVEAVLGGGWFIISEMNFYWNGGGWGRVDFRYVYVRSGVSFIY
jgi:hypothetical protein